MIRLGIVIPCYNEEEALPETASRVFSLLERLAIAGKVATESFVCFVDDGSMDSTWTLISGFEKAGSPAMGLKLSRNFGHQTALLAGLLNAPGDALVSIDADLQDDINAIEKMLDAYASGADVVYGVRAERNCDSFFKRVTAAVYYRTLAQLGVETIHDHADFRLMSRRAVESLRQFGEANLYLRGIVPRIGLPHAIVEYTRAPRIAGKSKYPLSRMLSLAWDGITGFSVLPLRWVTICGFLVFLGTLLMSAWILWVRVFTDEAVPGWASTVIPLFLLGGLQILSIGIVGEYLGKVYIETKSRPRFLVEETIEPRRLAREPALPKDRSRPKADASSQTSGTGNGVRDRTRTA